MTFKVRFQPLMGIGQNLLPAVRLVWQSAPYMMVASVVVVAMQAIMPLVPLYLVRLIVNAIADGADVEVIIALVAGAGLATAATMALHSMAAYIREAQAQTLGDYVQSVIHRKSIEVDLGYYEGPEFFEKLHRAQEEAPFRPAMVVENLMTMLRTSISLLGIVGILLYVLPSYVLLALAAASIPLGFVRLLFSRRRFRWAMKRTATERWVLYLNWLLTGREHAKELRIFGLNPLLASRSERQRETLRSERLSLAKRRSTAEVFSYVIQTAAVFAVVAFMAVQSLRGETTLGDLVMLLQAVQRGQTLMGELLAGANGLYESNLFLATVFAFLGLRPTLPDPVVPAPLPQPIRTGLELKNVDFTYPNTARRVLDNVSICIGPGEMVALVGDNGAGKTTLMKLVCRFYDPTGGSITLDGTDLRAIRKQEWWGNITALFQDPAQYHYPVWENVWFGRPEKDPDWGCIYDATEQACADQFVRALPAGYDTPLGRFLHEGAELSGGQWKKIALARTFYRACGLAILDEPTSGVDPDSEASLLAGLREWGRDKSVLIVTHRVAAARIADRIYVMRSGRIVEHGTHEELCALDGIYGGMYRTQLGQLQGRAL